MISDIFIDRPRLTFVVSIVIAMTTIPVAQFPETVPPQVTLTTLYPGADAEVVEATVAQPIEQQLNGSTMRYTTSRRAALTAATH
jgi:hydrophobic/amphiphilic exporter-1 (mainly G- bacteria), HAE1 family